MAITKISPSSSATRFLKYVHLDTHGVETTHGIFQCYFPAYLLNSMLLSCISAKFSPQLKEPLNEYLHRNQMQTTFKDILQIFLLDLVSQQYAIYSLESRRCLSGDGYIIFTSLSPREALPAPLGDQKKIVFILDAKQHRHTR